MMDKLFVKMSERLEDRYKAGQKMPNINDRNNALKNQGK
jgi:hypothetical protein